MSGLNKVSVPVKDTVDINLSKFKAGTAPNSHSKRSRGRGSGTIGTTTHINSLRKSIKPEPLFNVSPSYRSTLFTRRIKATKTSRRKMAEARIQNPNHHIKQIIAAAERKLFNNSLSKHERKLATQYLKDNLESASSPNELAMIALLGVLNAYITGCERPVIQINWGNLFSIPEYDPYHGNLSGGAPINYGNRINHLYLDNSLGLESEKIIAIMQNPGFYTEFSDFIKSHGFSLNEPTSFWSAQPYNLELATVS